MAQLLLPLFSSDTVMLTPVLGVFEKDGTVFYLHSGVPIYSHAKGDLMKFRYITSNLIVQGLCGNRDIERVFHVSESSVLRWKNKFLEEGESAFFKAEHRHGYCYKITGEVLVRIQRRLDSGRTPYSIAKEEGLSEGSIRYAIKQGYLKKSPPPVPPPPVR